MTMKLRNSRNYTGTYNNLLKLTGLYKQLMFKHPDPFVDPFKPPSQEQRVRFAVEEEEETSMAPVLSNPRAAAMQAYKEDTASVFSDMELLSSTCSSGMPITHLI